VDNGGKTGQATELPSLGSGVAQAGTANATLVTDRAVNVPAYFAGNWVEIKDSTGTTLKGRWRISTAPADINGKSVVLVPNGAETISLLAGDKWQGIYRFDNAVTVRNGATLNSVDPIKIGPNPALRADERPAAVPAGSAPGDADGRRLAIRSISLCSSGLILAPGGSLAVCAVVEGEGDLSIEAKGAFEGRAVAENGCATFAIPPTAKPGSAVLELTLTARDGRIARASRRVTVLADRRAPAVTRVYPADGTVLFAGESTKVGIEAWDDARLAGAVVTVGTAESVLAAAPFEIELKAPSVDVPRMVPVVLRVFDAAGNVSTRRLTLEVRPGARPFGFRQPAAPAPTPDVDGLRVDGGWPFPSAPDTDRTVVLPSVGHGVVAGVAGTSLFADALWTSDVAGSYVDVARGAAAVGRFRIVAVSSDGNGLVLEDSAAGLVLPGDTFHGVKVFRSVELVGSAHVVTADLVEADSLTIDASSSLESANLAIPGDTSDQPGPCGDTVSERPR
jgi:hypothetical protein